MAIQAICGCLVMGAGQIMTLLAPGEINVQLTVLSMAFRAIIRTMLAGRKPV